MKRLFDYSKFEEELEVCLAQDLITDWRFQTAGQYSVNHKTLFLYPKSKKCFYKPTKEWGTYEDLEDFLILMKDFSPVDNTP